MKSEAKNNNIFFDTKHLRSDIKARSLRSGAVTLFSQVLSVLINLGSTMILARLLTPQDYGMIAMVAAITGFAGIFSDLGLSTATIQRADITHRQVSNLFWVNVCLGVIITIIVMAIAPAVARFYNTPELLWVTVVLSLNFMVTGLVVQHKALLTRQMQFLTIAKIEISSTLLGISIAVIMAIYGYRYWSLVFNTLTVSTCSVICFWLTSKWRPSLPQRKSGVSSMIRFGSDIAGFNIINYLSRNLDNILIGRYYGPDSLGVYSKAYQLLMFPISNLRDPLNKVVMPSLSSLQHEPARYRSYYVKYLSVLAFITMPLVVFMFVCSANIINLVLGPQWINASELFKILAVTALIQPVVSTQGAVVLSTGQSRRYFWWGTSYAFVIVLSFILGLPWGAKGIATSYAIANYILIYPSLYYCFRGTPIKIIDFFLAIYRPMLAALIMGLGCYYLNNYLAQFGGNLILALNIAVSAGLYLIALVIISGGIGELREYFEYGRLVFQKCKL